MQLCPAFPTPILPTPLCTLADCCVVEVCNQAELSHSTAWLQCTCALKAPLSQKMKIVYAKKRSHPAFPMPFLPTPLLTFVNCGVIEMCNWAEWFNSTAQLQCCWGVQLGGAIEFECLVPIYLCLKSPLLQKLKQNESKKNSCHVFPRPF